MPTRDRRPLPHLKPPKEEAVAGPVARPNAAPSSPPRRSAGAASRLRNAPAAAKSLEEQPGYDPLAPRLRPAGAPPDRQVRERENRRLRARIVEVERRIGEKEQEVKDIEHLMATPGFYDDRASADRAVADRQRLLAEVSELMAEWESLQSAVEVRG